MRGLPEKRSSVTLTFLPMARRLLLAAALLLLAPASAQAGLPTLSVREVPLHGERVTSGTGAGSFQLIGVHWRGPGRLELRTRGLSGGWTPWQRVAELDEDAPDTASAEARGAVAWRKSAPVWVGNGAAYEVRAVGRVLRARALTVRSPVAKVPFRAVAAAGMPRVVARSAWLADEKLVRAKPSYADTLRMAYVHHTAGTNTYTRLEAPAVVRAIQAYHVEGNGWNDIGYNALVDRFGTVYEGRVGGLDRNVVGAHARGFNTGSFGIAVMGDFRTVAPPRAATDALVETLAWRLDLGHVDPLGTFNGISAGNERFAPGIPVFLRAISGHRDTGATTCPGERLYDLVPELTRRAAALGLPKIYAPLAESDETGGTRFTARLSGTLPWSVSIVDAAGAELARGEGTGTTVDWTWLPPAPLAPGTRWRIETAGATSAEGALAVAATATLQVTDATATPATVSPNGDGQNDTAVIAFTVSADANVTATVVDAAGATVAELERRWRRAGPRELAFDASALADGAYVVRILARGTGGREAAIDVPVAVSRTLGRVALAAATVTPNGDGRADTLTATVPLAAQATVVARIVRGGRWVATPFTGLTEPGELTVAWDGSKRLGRALDGDYVLVVEVSDAVGTSTVELPFLLDGTAPAVRVVSAVPPRLWVSEAAVLRVRVNNAPRWIRTKGPGTVRIPRVERLRTLVVQARDRAGNETTFRR